MNQRLFFPATERNRKPIGDLLETVLPTRGAALEIASGSGEHAITFQQRFPKLLWQASDPDPNHRASINAWIRHAGLQEVMPDALDLDVLQRPWCIPGSITSCLSAITCINLLHISPPGCTNALLKESARLLPNGSPLIIYGPFMRNGEHTSDSNAAFDRSLKERNHEWGLRDVNAITSLATKLGFRIDAIRPMPANNLVLILRRS